MPCCKRSDRRGQAKSHRSCLSRTKTLKRAPLIGGGVVRVSFSTMNGVGQNERRFIAKRAFCPIHRYYANKCNQCAITLVNLQRLTDFEKVQRESKRIR